MGTVPIVTINVSPEPTPTAYSTHGDTLTVNLKTFAYGRLALSLDQQLVVIPREELGYYGWEVDFDEHYLQLGAQIDVRHPPATGWMWIPRRVGQTQLTIAYIEPCRNYHPPCSVPDFRATFDITITQ